MPLWVSTTDQRYRQGVAQREEFETRKAAMKYCKDNDVSAKAAVKTGKFPGLNWRALHQRLKGYVINGTEHEARSLLLFEEEIGLCQWILECGNNMMGRDREMVGEG